MCETAGFVFLNSSTFYFSFFFNIFINLHKTDQIYDLFIYIIAATMEA